MICKMSRKTYRKPSLQRYGQLSRVTQGSSGTDNDGMGTFQIKTMGPPTMTMTMSDRRLKYHIVRVGELCAGMGLYLFNYLNPESTAQAGRQLGVMADEVARVQPHAVSRRPDGFLQVDYQQLNFHPADLFLSRS